MLTKEEVEKIFSRYYVIDPPKHLIMIDKPVSMEEKHGGFSFLKGIQPKHRNDIIFLTSLADTETVIHETLHTYGFGEFAALRLGVLLNTRNFLSRRFPVIDEFCKKFVKEVHYDPCYGCQVCNDLKIHSRDLRVPKGSNPKHYVLRE